MIIVGGAGSITRDFQADFDGLLLGAGTPYGVTSWGGFLDQPSVRTQSNARPLRNGMFLSADYDGGKIYDLEFDIATDGGVAFSDAVNALVAGTYSQETLRPLRFRLPNLGVRIAMVQCRKRAIPVDLPYAFGLSERAALQFYAPDGRQYGPSVGVPTGLRFGGTGLSYPLTYPLSYGIPPSGGRLAFTNTGSASTEPVFTVTGPLTQGFEITYVETGRRLRYVGSVGTDLVLDCGEGTVTTQGQERGPFLTIREWFSIPGGATATFALASLGAETSLTTPTAGMTVTVAPAYL